MDEEGGLTKQKHDSMGTIEVPQGALWGAQTQRAVENFSLSGQHVDTDLLKALAQIKGAAAKVNARLDVIAPDVALAIEACAVEVAVGRWWEHFPVDVFQTGSGTSTNMNMNEVIASLAGQRLKRPVHANDEVNASQSSNDTFPSAVHLAALALITDRLLPAFLELASALEERADGFAEVVKSGRTHLMDATPVTLGQEFGGYARQIRNGYARVEGCLQRLGELALGGTAVGTGLNAPSQFAAQVIQELQVSTGLTLSEAANHFEAQGARDALVECSATLRTSAISLFKISNDLRWMASGPNCGLGEIHLPALQPGSSIMPGKVNPVVPEAVCQIAAQVIGNDAAIAFGGSAGNFELNVMIPVMARNLLESIKLLAAAMQTLASKCVVGIVADEQRCRTLALLSPSIATSLVPELGYEVVAGLVKSSIEQNRDLRTLVLERNLLSEEAVDRALDVATMTRGGIL